jgi:hypothetical protein
MVATRLNRRHLHHLLWLAIVLQVGLVFYKSQPHLTNDSPTYLELARQLDAASYGTGSDDGFRPEATRPPGYPIFLWLFLHGLGLPWASVIIAQYGLYLLAVYLAQRLLTKHAFSPLPLLLLVLAYPFPATYSARVMPEGLTLFLVTLLAYLLARPGELTASTALWAGAVSGVAILVRPNLALLPAGLALFFFWASYRGGAAFVALKRATLMLLVTALVLSPYAIRNYAVFGMPTPLPPAGPLGHSLYLATWEGELTNADQQAFIMGQVTEAARNSGFASEVARLNKSMGAPPMTAPYSPDYYESSYHKLAGERVFRRAALDRIAAAPGAYLRLVVKKWWRLWNTAEYPAAVPLWAQVFLKVVSAVICLLGFGGAAYALFGQRDYTLKVPSMIVLYFPLVHAWLHTEARYTAPARLLLLFNAAVLLLVIGTKLAHRRMGHMIDPVPEGPLTSGLGISSKR